jgi:hypothetical protein
MLGLRIRNLLAFRQRGFARSPPPVLLFLSFNVDQIYGVTNYGAKIVDGTLPDSGHDGDGCRTVRVTTTLATKVTMTTG